MTVHHKDGLSWYTSPESTADGSSPLMMPTACLEDLVRRAEWLDYEVAPEWERFCSFGPEDIGSVWEKIGAIRKRPQPRAFYVSRDMLAELQVKIAADLMQRTEQLFFPDSIYGIPVHVLPPEVGEKQAFMTTKEPLGFINPVVSDADDEWRCV